MHCRLQKIDLLHNVDCKGVASAAIANCLCEIVYRREIPGMMTHDDSLEWLNADLDLFYQNQRVENKIPTLVLENFVDLQKPLQNYPMFKGPGIKAANTRALMPWLQSCLEVLDQTDEQKQRRFQLVKLFNDFFELIYGEGEWLSEATAQRLQKIILQILKRCAWLHEWALANGGHIRWQLVPKHHYFFHIALFCVGYCRNPRCYQTYIDESFVGRMCRVMANSQDGPFHDALQMTTLEKYLTALSIQFSFDD